MDDANTSAGFRDFIGAREASVRHGQVSNQGWIFAKQDFRTSKVQFVSKRPRHGASAPALPAWTSSLSRACDEAAEPLQLRAFAKSREVGTVVSQRESTTLVPLKRPGLQSHSSDARPAQASDAIAAARFLSLVEDDDDPAAAELADELEVIEERVERLVNAAHLAPEECAPLVEKSAYTRRRETIPMQRKRDDALAASQADSSLRTFVRRTEELHSRRQELWKDWSTWANRAVTDTEMLIQQDRALREKLDEKEREIRSKQKRLEQQRLQRAQELAAPSKRSRRK